MSIEILGDGLDGNVAESSLLFCKLPPRKSVTALDEQPRLSYYNSNEKQTVPFKWEASPGKPMISNEAHRNRESPRVAPLRPPPGSGVANGGLRSRRVSSELSRDDEFDRRNFSNPRLATASGPLPSSHQRARLPPKNRMLGRLPQPSSSNAKNTIGSSNSTRDPGSNSSHRPGHRRSTESDDSFTSCGRSDFDWPEVSDEEEYGTPPQEQEQHKPSNGSNGFAAAPRAGGGGGGHAKEELSFSSSRSSLSSVSTTSSPANSGGSRGGSARDIMLWRNLVNIAAAHAVGPPSTSYAVPFKPSYGGGESYSEEDEAEDADAADHVRPSGRGFLSCMPIFSRKIHSQSTSKAAAERSEAIDFANRLAPGIRNKTYRS